MPAHMSFSLTTHGIINRKKDVTRRFGWRKLRPGDRIWAVRKAMGLKKGEKVERLALLEIVSTREEPVNAITQQDVYREHVPGITTPEAFVKMICEHYGRQPTDMINRIEFRYVDEYEQLRMF